MSKTKYDPGVYVKELLAVPPRSPRFEPYCGPPPGEIFSHLSEVLKNEGAYLADMKVEPAGPFRGGELRLLCEVVTSPRDIDEAIRRRHHPYRAPPIQIPIGHAEDHHDEALYDEYRDEEW